MTFSKPEPVEMDAQRLVEDLRPRSTTRTYAGKRAGAESPPRGTSG